MGFLLTLLVSQNLALAVGSQTTRELEQRLIQIQEALKDNDTARDEAVRQVNTTISTKIDSAAVPLITSIDKLTVAILAEKDHRLSDLELKRAYLSMISDFIVGVVGPLLGAVWVGGKAVKRFRGRNGVRS
jgi:hypothetical protein